MGLPLVLRFLSALVVLLMPSAAMAAGEGAPHLEGGALSILYCAPFVGILLSIAVFPLVAPSFWHHHFGKVAAFWAAAFLIPFTIEFGFDLALFELLHVGLLEYVPFIILLFALFVIAGGVRVTGQLKGTPLINSGILLLGTLLASLMGTTGAAMLLVRPLLKSNAHRKSQVHIFVFFIFLVGNIGGSLTPLGDPPLFLGFLKGVGFFWPTEHMLLPMLLVATPLLAIFFFLDSYFYRREGAPVPEVKEGEAEKLGLEGSVNLLLLVGVIGAVLMSGLWKSEIVFDIYYVPVPLQDVVRSLLLLLLAFASLKLTQSDSRAANGFSWFPIIEVAKLFAGIFLTIVPVIAELRAGEEGALKSIVHLVSDDQGRPLNDMYFWITGALSSFLDNAPTYLVFFNMASGDAVEMMGPLETTLLAISSGAVFWGAMTYIGNAPNFMIRSICEERGVKMPSFFGYMGWSLLFLAPLFLLVDLIFFA